ncbi:hypothetical protein [Corynebacterium urogenitale]
MKLREVLYLKATPEELDRVVPKLESRLKRELKVVSMRSLVADTDPQEEFMIPPVSPDGEWLSSNCQVRIELAPTEGKQLSEVDLDRLGEQFMEIFNELIDEDLSIPYFSFLDA